MITSEAGTTTDQTAHGRGRGDAGRYPCPRCPAELELAELLDHIEAHAGLSTRHTTFTQVNRHRRNAS